MDGRGGMTGMPFAPLFTCCNCRRAASGSIPGIGVPPGFTTTLAFFGSGMPGVGVAPRGIFALATGGMPGVEFPVGTIGLAENPGGRWLALTFCIFTTFALAFAPLAFEFVSTSPPHAAANTAETAVAAINILFINKIPSSFKHSCAGSNVASLEVSDGVRTGTGRYQTVIGR